MLDLPAEELDEADDETMLLLQETFDTLVLLRAEEVQAGSGNTASPAAEVQAGASASVVPQQAAGELNGASHSTQLQAIKEVAEASSAELIEGAFGSITLLPDDYLLEGALGSTTSVLAVELLEGGSGSTASLPVAELDLEGMILGTKLPVSGGRQRPGQGPLGRTIAVSCFPVLGELRWSAGAVQHQHMWGVCVSGGGGLPGEQST